MIPYQCACSTEAVSDGPVPTLATALFSLGTRPSPVFFSALEGVSTNIRSQIAVKMALDAMISEAPARFEAGERPDQSLALEIVRDVFREANSKVYEYSHRMGSGGQISAKGIVAVFDGNRVSIGQAGDYESYLWRGGKIVPFYERKDNVTLARGGVLERFIGANTKILVDLATVAVRKGDIIVITTTSPTDALKNYLLEVFKKSGGVSNTCHEVARRCAKLLAAGHDDAYSFKHGVVFLLVIDGEKDGIEKVEFKEFNGGV